MKFRPELFLLPLNLIWQGRKVAKDIAYGEHKRNKLDVYDRNPKAKNKPVIIFWFGGSWQHGFKHDYKFVGNYLSRHGIAIIPDYPMYPDQTYPGFIEDAGKVLEWVRKNIRSFGGDPEKIYVIGHSAGAHTAMVLTLQDSHVRGCIGLGTPATMSADRYGHIFNGKLDDGSAFLINMINRKVNAKFMLMQGLLDNIVSPDNTEKLESLLRLKGNSVEAVYIKFFDHVGILQVVGSPLGRFLKTHKILKQFFQT